MVQSVPQVSHVYVTSAIPLPVVPFDASDSEAPFARLAASAALIWREDFDVVWYMEERSSSEVGATGAGGLVPPLRIEAEGLGGLVPGCSDWSPRGVSRTTRKWPVKGGAKVAGRASGSI